MSSGEPPPAGQSGDGPTVALGDVEEVETPERWAALAADCLAHEGVRGPGELSLSFVDVATMTEANEHWREGAGPTDVLAFPMDELPPPGGADGTDAAPYMIGDVVICAEVARANAAGRNSIDDELALLVVHGVLHLLGHDHYDPDETALMRSRERELLEAYHRVGAPTSAEVQLVDEPKPDGS